MISHFSHSAVVCDQFPELQSLTFRIDNVRSEMEVAKDAANFVEIAKIRLAKLPEGEFPEIQAWRRAFARMGLKPTQYRSAPEALLRRLRTGGELPNLHPLIVLCNALSVAYALPVAVFDCDKISGLLEVRPATGTECYRAFSGEEERPEVGEIIFADDAQEAHARRWCHRQSAASAVSAITRSAIIVVESMHEGGITSLSNFEASFFKTLESCIRQHPLIS